MACTARRILGVALASGIAWGAGMPASAQADQRAIERSIRQAEEGYYRLKVDSTLSVTERSLIDFGGFASLVFLNLREADANYSRLFQPEVTLYGRAVIDGAHSFFGRARFQYRDYSSGDSFDERGDRWTEPFLDRYWYEFDLARAVQASEGRTPANNFNVRVGRQFVDWGAGLTLSETLYAARPSLRFGRLEIEGLAGVTPTDESVIDFDRSRVGYDNETERGYFGGLLRYTTRSSRRYYAFYLHEEDYNGSDRPRANLGVTSLDFEYNARYVGVGTDGSLGTNWLYLGELVYEFGESTSDPLRGLQPMEDISAWAGRAQLTYLFRDRSLTRAEAEVLFATGDDDRFVTTDTVGGNAPGTTDHAFNGLGYVNTGLAFSPELSNLFAVRLGIATFPFVQHESLRNFQVTFDAFLHNKFDSDAPIDEPTDDDAFLGVETDFGVNYRITSDLSFVGRYGLFFPGSSIQGESDVRQFLYLGVTLSF